MESFKWGRLGKIQVANQNKYIHRFDSRETKVEIPALRQSNDQINQTTWR